MIPRKYSILLYSVILHSSGNYHSSISRKLFRQNRMLAVLKWSSRLIDDGVILISLKLDKSCQGESIDGKADMNFSYDGNEEILEKIKQGCIRSQE